MQTKPFTVATVKALPTGKHRDPGCAGLYMWVQGNTRSWQFRYTFQRVPGTLSLGTFPSVGLKEARDLATEHRAGIAKGTNPKGTPPAPAQPAITPTFEQHARLYYARHEAVWSAGHAQNWINGMERHVFPAIGQTPTRTLTTTDICGMIQPIWGNLTIAPRILGGCTKVVDFAIGSSDAVGVDFPNGNIVPGAKSRLKILLSDVRGHGAVSGTDIPKVFARLRAAGSIPLDAVCLLLLLCTPRAAEVHALRWDDIQPNPDLPDVQAMRIAGANRKGNKQHKRLERYIPLSSHAVAFIDGMRARRRDSEFLFPNRRRNIRADAAMDADSMRQAFVSEVQGVDPKTGRGFDVHGLRATFSTWAANQNQSERAIETALDHATFKTRTQGAYDRAEVMLERLKLAEAWGAHLTGEG